MRVHFRATGHPPSVKRPPVFAWAAGANVTLRGGTEVELILLHHINAQHVPAGSTVYLGVAEDIVAGGQVVIPRGRFVEGTVESVVKQLS